MHRLKKVKIGKMWGPNK